VGALQARPILRLLQLYIHLIRPHLSTPIGLSAPAEASYSLPSLPDVADSILYPPEPVVTKPLFYLPYSTETYGNGVRSNTVLDNGGDLSVGISAIMITITIITTRATKWIVKMRAMVRDSYVSTKDNRVWLLPTPRRVSTAIAIAGRKG
jgi:hypothetical protein